MFFNRSDIGECGGVGSQNGVMRAQTTHCDGRPTNGVGPPLRIMGLPHLVYSSTVEIHSSDDAEDALICTKDPEVDMRQVDRHSIYTFESEPIN